MSKKISNELITFIKPEFEFSDERGKLIQLVSNGWNQVNIIDSLANTTRGNHYHKINREGFFIITGKFKLLLVKDDLTKDFIIEKNDFFIIEPYVKHTFEYLENTILVSLYDKGVINSDSSKDIFI